MFSIDESGTDFQEMVSGNKNKEEQTAGKKNPKSQNAFEEVCSICVLTIAAFERLMVLVPFAFFLQLAFCFFPGFNEG